ncbi:ACT domain-containing protein [Dactylosporangium sp. CS-033363]|uniref:ACT domain-containing protein n=1 Tax=Dactylosporangium sp. CS-033363 TaxID=3239935 RepID=UPI003D8EE372
MLDLALLPGDYAICRLPAGSAVPAGLAEAGASGEGVISVTWTPEEVSILCPAERAPAGATVETPWRCLRVAGPVQLALTGILASIVSPLADARVNIFAFSTFDTDYLLVPAVRMNEALAALSAAGHRVTT